MELDLVEISPNAKPPVCKIIDYKKFLYEQKKREKVLKAKAAKVVIKEIRFGPQTDEHDYEFKKKNALKFLQEGAKLKAFVFFKGRTILFKEKGKLASIIHTNMKLSDNPVYGSGYRRMKHRLTALGWPALLAEMKLKSKPPVLK